MREEFCPISPKGKECPVYNYGLIGNCQVSALVSENGSIDWLCLPRPDSPPIFGALLDKDGGAFTIQPAGKFVAKQSYVQNSNVLVTRFACDDGSSFRVTDFCPRFDQHGRVYKPLSIFRVVEPEHGSPAVKVTCRPVNGWDKQAVNPVRGNSHLRFEYGTESLRLTTNMPLTFLCEESPFQLREPLYFALTWGLGIEDELASVSRRFLDQTNNYWNLWVKHCSIPSHFQNETIRSALALKLHCYEDTGAILAATTTSLPEEAGHERNWDYRFCWLRDSYYVLSAFHKLGHFEEMEGFLKFLLGIAEKHEHSRERLAPVYRLDQSLPLPEIAHLNWDGYHGSKPVRSNNQAAEHVQNDVYGEMVLTLAPIFLDDRFHHLRNPTHEQLLVHFGKLCASNISRPDAGLWEIRDGWKEHSFSNLMCWAGLERIRRIRERGYLPKMSFDLDQSLIKAEASVRAAFKEGSLRNGPGDDTYDAALLQMACLRFADPEVATNTVEKIYADLRLGDLPPFKHFLYRYRRRDDFGNPQSAFLVCSFWLVQALAATGKMEEARAVMKSAMGSANSLGLFAEHFRPGDRMQAGNFPQTYSHVGQIHGAFAVSPNWEEIL